MRADQPSASGIGVGSGIGDLEVWALVFVDERLDDQRAAIFDREGFEHLQQVRNYPALVGDLQVAGGESGGELKGTAMTLDLAAKYEERLTY